MLVDLTIELAEAIATDLRASDRAEIMAANGSISLDWIDWAHRVIAIPGYRIGAMLGDLPLLMGGFIDMPMDGVCGAWMVATPAIDLPGGRALAARAITAGHAAVRQTHSQAITWADASNEDAMAMLVRLGYRGDGAARVMGGRRFVGLSKELR